MNFGRAFTYVTEDPEWFKKVGVAALVMLIPIIGQIVVLGWSIEVTRRVIKGEPDTLPDWSNFSDFLSKGFQAFVISFAYLLPVIILNTCTSVLPAFIQNMDSDTGQAIAATVSIVTICLSCIIIAYAVAAGFILPAAIGNFVATGELGAGFRFSEVFGLVRAAPGPYFMAYLGGILASLIASLGFIACIIGVFFTIAFAYAIDAHLWGQAYNAAKAAQGMSEPAASVM